MKIKSTLFRCVWTLLLLILNACESFPSQQIITSTMSISTFTPITDGPTLLPTYTPFAAPTLDPSSYQTPTIPPFDVWLTQDAFATPIRTPVTPVWVESLHYGSDDGQKIVFYQDEHHENVYSANADESNRQLIIKSKSLPILGQGEVKALTFIPKTHILLFNTYLCNPRPVGPSYNAVDCTVSIYSVNTDTGKINEILAGLSGDIMQDRNFEVSPDGKYMSVANSGHIDIYYLSYSDSGPADGDMFHQNAIVYWRTRPDEYLPRQYWLPDSSGLIAVVATSGYNEPGTPPAIYAAFRYSLGDTTIQIPLDKFMTWGIYGPNAWSISPDRNWIFFAGNDSGDRRNQTSNYIGNLNNGHTQLYEPGVWIMEYLKWSPDSKHFAFSNSIGFIGCVDGSFVPVGGSFVEWIDSTHYYYFVGDRIDTVKTYIGTLPPENVP